MLRHHVNQFARHTHKSFELHWFAEVSVGPERGGLLLVRLDLRGGPNHTRRSIQPALVTLPSKHVEPVDARHLEIKQHERWRGVFFTVLKFSDSGQVIHCVPSVSNVLQAAVNARLLHRGAEQDCTAIIIDEKNDWGHQEKL